MTRIYFSIVEDTEKDDKWLGVWNYLTDGFVLLGIFRFYSSKYSYGNGHYPVEGIFSHLLANQDKK